MEMCIKLQKIVVGEKKNEKHTQAIRWLNNTSNNITLIFCPQERLRRLNHNVAKETARRKTMLEASGVFTSRSPSKP